MSWIVAGGDVELPMSGGAVTLVVTPVAYDGSVICDESAAHPHDAGHAMESVYVPEELAGLLPAVKVTIADRPPATTTVVPAAAFGLTHGSASGVRTSVDADRVMFCAPAVDVAASDTVFGIEYPVGARKLTVIVCDELAASVVVAGLAAHDVIDPHDGASVSGSANDPEFVTVKAIDPAAPR